MEANGSTGRRPPPRRCRTSVPATMATLLGEVQYESHSFESDVLACPQCGGRMVILATIDDPAVIQRILRHLGLPLDAGDHASARGSPEADGRGD